MKEAMVSTLEPISRFTSILLFYNKAVILTARGTLRIRGVAASSLPF